MTLDTALSTVSRFGPHGPALADGDVPAWPSADAALPAAADAAAHARTDALAQQGLSRLHDMAHGAQGAFAPGVVTAQAASPRELSGRSWVSRFPTSRSLDDLAPGFREKATAFVTAMRAAGADVRISATHRPAERAYLMRYAWDIAKGLVQPGQVPSHPNVPINWNHGTKAKSVAAAKEMVNAYGIVYRPSLSSNHIQGTAIDMTVRNIIGKTMTDASGRQVTIRSMEDLYTVGASYGVRKLRSDPPHWSANGR